MEYIDLIKNIDFEALANDIHQADERADESRRRA